VRYLERLSQHLLVFGIPGLLLIALLDGAAVPLVGGPDAVLLLLAWQRPAQLFLIVPAAVIGSTIGCIVLYRIGRAGGGLALARLAPEKRAWVKTKLEQNAAWTLFVAVIAPPPFPTKPFILTAGIIQIRLRSFTAAVFAGRVVRYSLLGYLGARYGKDAAQLIRAWFPQFLLSVIAIICLVAAIRWYRRRHTEIR
jgi:membrane protein YqaA with SNARE-associated domain